MPDDSRIVPGGELPITGEGLDEVALDSASSGTPQTSASVAQPGQDFGEYTLNENIIRFLSNSIKGYGINGINPYSEGLAVENLLKENAIRELATHLGADFYTLDNFTLTQTTSFIPYLTADLSLTTSIPKQSFQKGLTALLGGEETVQYLLTTDIAQALGLDDPTKPVDLNDSQLQEMFPDITQIKSLNGKYVVPADPYIFLLAVNPQYRRFLSACLDKAKEDSQAPFSLVGGDYNVSELDNYGIGRGRLHELVNTGFLGLPTIVKVGQQFGVKELKPYLDSLAKLKENLNNVINQ
jgi:hypothetical protein